MKNDYELEIRARRLSYKKSCLNSVGYEIMLNDLEEIWETSENLSFYLDDDEGDEDNDTRFAYMDISSGAQTLAEQLRESEVKDYFDDAMVACVGNRTNVLGFDQYETDYFSLTSYESDLAVSESGKRILKKTKNEMIALYGQCIGITLAYLDLKYRFDLLDAAYDLQEDENTLIAKNVKRISEIYEKANDEIFCGEYTDELNRLIYMMPDRVWVE